MVICSPQLGLSPKSVLGGEVFDRQILLSLAKKGIRVHIILPYGAAHDSNVKNWRFTQMHFAHLPAILFNLIELPYLISVFNKEPFQILRIHQPQFLGIGALVFKFINKKVKLVVTYHKFEETNFLFFSNYVNQKWDHIICDSENVKRKIINKYNIAENKVTVVHNGVPNYLKPAPKDKNLLRKYKLENKTVLLFMGLFIDRKNPLHLIDVLEELVKKYPDIVQIFWGTGPLKSKILEKAKSKNLSSNIRFIEPVYGQEKSKIHNLADIFVHSSIDEGFSLAPLEAMACAKPVIMTKGFSAEEAVENGITGFVCKQNNVKDWVNKISFFLDYPQKQIQFGKESFKKAKKEYRWDVATSTHVQVFKRLIKDQ